MTSCAFRLDGIGIAVGSRNLLSNVGLRVERGERVAIIGANGAGKTTLLKSLTGMVGAASGSIEVLGHALSAKSSADELRMLRNRVGQIFQGLHLVGRLSALENVLVGALGRCSGLLTCARFFPEAERERAIAALEAVGIGHLALARADKLSGGERQKVAIARALNQSPDMLLADEPTANLDPSATREIAALLARIASERKLTLVTVAHSLELLPDLADRVVGMKAGRILFDRPTGEIDENLLRDLYSTPVEGSRTH